jgi:hypothetical protein
MSITNITVLDTQQRLYNFTRKSWYPLVQVCKTFTSSGRCGMVYYETFTKDLPCILDYDRILGGKLP